ncbi:MAG: flippase-like domain-containing protein [Alphaproteobacteria bacterium]|nr:flippase-like domain-containing protein [Alphaproteobacteria bacterium]
MDPPPDDDARTAGESRQSLRKLSGWQGRHGALRGVAVVTITILVLAILLRQTDPQMIAAAAGRLPTTVWFAALAIAIAFPLLSTTRWWLMMRAAKGAQPWGRLLTAYLGICPVNLISPSKSGDLLRALALSGKVASSRVYASLMIERSFDLLVLGLLVLIGGVLSQNPLNVGLSIFVILAVVAALIIGTLSGSFVPARMSLAAYFVDFSSASRGALGRPDLLTAAFALTVLHWSLVGLLVTLVLAGSGAQVTLADTMTAMPAAILVGMLPVTIAGAGTREGAMLWLFSGYASPSQILAAGLLYTFLVYCLPALAGLPFTRSVLRI